MILFRLKSILKVFLSIFLFLIFFLFNLIFSGVVFAQENPSVMDLDGWTTDSTEVQDSVRPYNQKVFFGFLRFSLILMGGYATYFCFFDNYILLSYSEAQTLLHFFKNSYTMNTFHIEGVEALQVLDPANTTVIECEPNKNFINALKLIVKCIGIIHRNQGLVESTPEFKDHVFRSFEKNFPNWTKYLNEYNII